MKAFSAHIPTESQLAIANSTMVVERTRFQPSVEMAGRFAIVQFMTAQRESTSSRGPQVLLNDVMYKLQAVVAPQPLM